MQKYEVGQKYPIPVPPGTDTCRMDYTQSGIYLEIFASNLGQQDIKSFKKDDIEIALYQKQPVILLLYRIGKFMPWSDVPYSWHLTLKNKVELAEIEEIEKITDKGILITILLIDSDTGILKAIRAIGAGIEFRNEFFRAVKKQNVLPFSQRDYDLALNQIYMHETKELLMDSTGRFLLKK